MLKYESSLIDWCENNYVINNYICEILNTITGFIFIIFSLFDIYNIYSVFNKLNFLTLFIYLLYLTTGIGTVLFHSTLSIFGQYVDEISILILIIFLYYDYKKDMLLTAFGFISLFMPEYNRIFLLISSGIILFKVKYLNICNLNEYHKSLSDKFILQLEIGVCFWLIDLLACDYLIISLHWIWHIFSCLFLHNLIALLTYKKYIHVFELIDYKYIIFIKQKIIKDI